MRLLKSLFLGALLAGCSFIRSGPPPAPAPPLASVFIASEVIQAMYDIQRFFPVETARCLRGSLSATGHIEILSMTPTWVNESDAWHVNFRSCEGFDVVGWYHNHPGPEEVCFPSEADQTVLARSGVYIIVLTCARPETLVWMYANIPHVYSWTGSPPSPP